MARRVDDGRVEFGLQERAGAESWGSRLSPSKRFFPVDVAVDKWLVSSPVSVSGGVVRIVARRVDDGRVEFGLQERAGAESWGSRMSPSKRFFPVDVAVDKWLVSSPVSVGGVATTGGSGAVACAGVRPPEFIAEVIREAVCLPDIPGRVRFFRMGGSGDVEANPSFFRHPHPNIMQTRLLLSTPLRLEVGTVFEMHHYVAPESRTPRVYLRGVDANGRRTVYRVTKVGGQLHKPNTPCTLYRPCYFRMETITEWYGNYGPPSEPVDSYTSEACWPVWPAEGEGMYHASPNIAPETRSNC